MYEAIINNNYGGVSGSLKPVAKAQNCSRSSSPASGLGIPADSKSQMLSEMKHRHQTRPSRRRLLEPLVSVEMTDELFVVVINSIECPSKHDLGVSLHVPLKSRLKHILKLFLN